MKKIFAFVLVAMMSMSAMAQHEIGAIVGGLNGVSYKYWVSDNLAVQADLAVGLTEVVCADSWLGTGRTFAWDIFDFTINPNVLYHFDLPADFKIYVGGGANIGMLGDLASTPETALRLPVVGKVGVNGVVGACYQLSSVPLALALDFRPGYGLGFDGQNDPTAGTWLCHMFDWKLAFAVRYCL